MTFDTTVRTAPGFPQLAFGDGTPAKATALVVGTILTVINHGEAIMVGDWPPAVKVAPAYMTPYRVAT